MVVWVIVQSFLDLYQWLKFLKRDLITEPNISIFIYTKLKSLNLFSRDVVTSVSNGLSLKN